jgi:hypothetical protein
MMQSLATAFVGKNASYYRSLSVIDSCQRVLVRVSGGGRCDLLLLYYQIARPVLCMTTG